MEMKGRSPHRRSAVSVAENALHESVDAAASQSVLMAVSDAEVAAVLEEAALAEKLDLHAATVGDPRTIVDAACPSLVMVEREHTSLDPLALCGAIQEHNATRGRDAAVVIVSIREDIEAQVREREVGASDWLLAPLDVMCARARLAVTHRLPLDQSTASQG